MPKSKEKLIPGYYYHIYNRAVDGTRLFHEDRNYSYFISKIKKYILQKSEVLAYCLMPNHYHFIIKVLQDGFSDSMQKLALSYVVSFNKAYQRKGHLFQGYFQRIHIKDLNYLLYLSQYIHLNPINANLVNGINDWKYSSVREYVGTKPIDFINPTVILDLISDDISSTLAEQQEAYLQSLISWQEEKKDRD
jgi:REP element-mobilizing transposase RayT